MNNGASASAGHDGRADFDFIFGRWRVHNRKLADVTDPACDDAEVFRSTDVVISQDGRVIGRLNNLITPQNDNGQKDTGELHTTTPIGCDDTEKVTYITQAQSYELPGTVTGSTRSFSFDTNCS